MPDETVVLLKIHARSKGAPLKTKCLRTRRKGELQFIALPHRLLLIVVREYPQNVAVNRTN